MKSRIRSRRLRSTYKLLRGIHRLNWSTAIRPIRMYQMWRVLPYTMVSLPRLANAYECVRTAIREGIEGDIAECGVWAGGAAGLMALAARDAGDCDRRIHLFDSFKGLPQPSAMDGATVINDYRRESDQRPLDDGTGNLFAINACSASLMLVKELFSEVLHIPDALVHIHEGWFQDTLPSAIGSGQIRRLATLRLDGDWYESTRVCLAYLYPLVSPGGFVTIDDYGFFEGCRRAVDEYIATLKPVPALNRIDSDGVYFRKLPGHPTQLEHSSSQ